MVVVRAGLFSIAGLLSLATAGCTGSPSDTGDDDGPDDGGPACVEGSNRPPAAPLITSPEAGRNDVPFDAVVIETGPFSDPDAGDQLEVATFEIWQTAGGEPVLRIWTASVTDPAKLHRVTLADGTFEVGATALQGGIDYQVIARHSDDAACDTWSDWSAPRRFRTDDGSTFWFDPDAVRDVRIEFSEETETRLSAQAVPPACVPFLREYFPGAAVLDGVRYEGAGVRTKGGCGSARDLTRKASFKVNLSWNDPAETACPIDRRSHGLKRLTLNNMVQDQSFVHERLAYRYYQLMGVATPRAQHARLFVNNQLWGLYLNVESIDRRFLSRWFESNDGMLYEGSYHCDLVPDNVPPNEEDNTSYCLARKFHVNDCESPRESGDPEDYSALRDMVDRLAAIPDGNFYPAIEQIFDFDNFLSMWAADTVLGHWDGYAIEIVNNYRVYHDPSTDRWSFIPTGLDQVFVRPDVTVGTAAGMLAVRCYAEEDCREVYLTRLRQAIDVFEQANLAAMAEDIRDFIEPFVDADPRKEFSTGEFRNRVNQTIEFIRDRPAQLRAAMP